MKQLILLFLIFPSLCFAGPLQQAHKAVVARQNVEIGGGGGGTERLVPDSNGGTNNWTDGSTDEYQTVDSAWGDRGTDGLEIAATATGDITIKGLSDPVGMGAGSTCTDVSIDMYAKDANLALSVEWTVAYSTDGGSSWSSELTVVPISTSLADYNVAWSSLSLTQTETNALQYRLTNSNSSPASVVETVSVEVTYE